MEIDNSHAQKRKKHLFPYRILYIENGIEVCEKKKTTIKNDKFKKNWAKKLRK